MDSSDQNNSENMGSGGLPAMPAALNGTEDTSGNSLIGKQLGNYTLDAQIGSGGMGIIYKAHHSVLKRLVAIKVVSKRSLSTGVGRKRFENEAKLLSLLSHPNIVSVHDFGFDSEGSAYLVMDYLEGESLAQRLTSGPLSIESFCEIMLQVCRGLIEAHKKGLVHRDIKPSNIFLSRESDGSEVVKLLDFGLAKEVSSEDQRLTSTGEIVGTPLYVSPEHLRNQKLDARSDIYSLGCVMYECLTGQTPFQGESAVDTVIQHLHKSVPHVTGKHFDRKTAEQLDILVNSCMAKKPDERYASVQELAADLERLSKKQAIERKRSWRMFGRGHRRPAVIACSVVALAGSGLLLYTKSWTAQQRTDDTTGGSKVLMQKLMTQASEHGVGEKEFVALHVEMMHVSRHDAERAFNVLDQDHNHYIDKDEMIAELLACNSQRLQPPVFVRRLAGGDGRAKQALRDAYAGVKASTGTN